jgi:hypothetical protein
VKAPFDAHSLAEQLDFYHPAPDKIALDDKSGTAGR